MRIVVALLAAATGCAALAACFHHRQTAVEYAPPPLPATPYK